MVRVYDMHLSHIKELAEVAGQVGGASGEALLDECAAKVRRSTLLAACAARGAVQLCWKSKRCLALTPTCVLCFLQAAQSQAGRCLYAGHAYLAAHKPREANAVFGRARERAAVAVERWRECEHPDAAALADLEAMPEQVEVSIQVEVLGKGQRWVLYAISVPQAMHGCNSGVAGDAPAHHTPGCICYTKASNSPAIYMTSN